MLFLECSYKDMVTKHYFVLADGRPNDMRKGKLKQAVNDTITLTNSFGGGSIGLAS